MNFKLDIKSQNLITTFRNTIAVFYSTGSIYEHFGPCAHILTPGWIYILYEYEKREIINAFIHFEGILSGKDNILTLSSSRVMETYDVSYGNKVQDKLNTQEWKNFVEHREIAIQNKGWFAEEYELYKKRHP
jgi:hypothetical protein